MKLFTVLLREASHAQTGQHKADRSTLPRSPVWFTPSGCPLEKAAVWVLPGPEGERSPLVTCQTCDRKYWDMVIIWHLSSTLMCLCVPRWNVRIHVHYMLTESFKGIFFFFFKHAHIVRFFFNFIFLMNLFIYIFWGGSLINHDV